MLHLSDVTDLREEPVLKPIVLCAALLLPAAVLSMPAAFAQAPAPQAAPVVPAPRKAHVARPKPAAAPAAQAAGKVDVMEITQIVGIRQVDPATYEVDAYLQNGTPLELRMNAFVMQDLGRRLGTYGQQPGG